MANLSAQTTQLFKKVSEIKNVTATYGKKLAEKLEIFVAQVLARKVPTPTATASVETATAEAATSSSMTPPRLQVENLLNVLAQVVEKLYQILELADEKVFKEQSDDQNVLLKRGQISETSRGDLIALKKSLEGTYGSGLLADLGLQGDTPQDPVEFHRLVKAALNVLNQKESLPPPRNPLFPGWSLDALKTYLNTIWQPLGAAGEEVRREARETQDAQIDRRTAMDGLSQAIVAFNGIFEAVARLVGETEIANRLRPAGGRPRKKQNDSDSGADTDGDEDNPKDDDDNPQGNPPPQGTTPSPQ